MEHRRQVKTMVYEVVSVPPSDIYVTRFQSAMTANPILTSAEVEEVQGLMETLRVGVERSPGWISEIGDHMPLGIYDHFKGGVYLSDRVVRWAETGEPAVVYVSMVFFGTWHARRCCEWAEVVKWPDGKYRSRFVYRGPDLKVPEPSFKVATPSNPNVHSLPPHA